MNPLLETKVCAKCKDVKSIDEFNKYTYSSDGYQSQCRVCQKAYYNAHKKELSEKHKEYYLENKEYIDTKTLNYYYENQDVQKEAHKLYKQNNKEKMQIDGKLYRQQTKDKIKLRYLMHKEMILKYLKIYRQENKESLRLKRKIYIKTKNTNNPQFKYTHLYRKYISFIFTPEVLKRDRYECQVCYSSLNLQVHHIIPVNINPNLVDDVKNLITLCTECHLYIGYKGQWKEFNDKSIDILKSIVTTNILLQLQQEQ